MNIRKYEAFIRAIEKGSLSKAAEELGYTQSGISHMMHSLEDEVGFSLLVRTSSGIVPNTEAKQLLPIIRQLLNTNESLEQHIAKIKGADVGRIRVAAFSSVAIYWLPSIISAFQKDYPDVEIQIIEGGANEIDTMMENREVDLCIYTGGGTRGFEWIPLCRDGLLGVFPGDHPLTKVNAVPVGAFEKEQFIMPMKGYDYEVHHILDQLDDYPNIRFSACNDYAIISMVTEGLGVSILPELVLRNYRNCAVTKRLDPPQYRTVGMGVPQLRTVSPVTHNFMRYITSYVKDVYQPMVSGIEK